MSIMLSQRSPNACALVDITHTQPRHPGVDQHGRNQLRAMPVAVGLDDREDVGVFTGGCAYRGDVIPQPRL